MNIHRINWIWGNKAAMESVGVSELPKTWADFNAACDKAVAGWQDLPCPPSALTGPMRRPSKSSSTARTRTCSRRPSSKATSRPCRSEGMIKAFDQMRLMVSKYMDPAIAGRDYDTASNMMANGDALFFIMGDWEIGVLKAVGHTPGDDILCGQAPTDWGKPGFILNSDSVVFFKQNDPDFQAGQKLLASTILSP